MVTDADEMAATVLDQKARDLISEREDLRQKLLALIERDEEIGRVVDDCVAGARALGFQIELPGLPRPEKERLLLSNYTNYRAQLRHALRTFLEAQKVRLASASADDGPEDASMPRISDIVLERLTAAGLDGAKSADIREFIETEYKKEIHEKTVGMTLYRLQVQGKVRRDGHVWFLVSNPEPKNPGVAAPGSLQKVQAAKGGPA